MERVRPGLMLTLAATLLAAGCGGGEGPGDEPRGAAAIADPVVTLRAELAGALGARAWLTAFAVRTTLIDGAAAPTTLGARRALDAGSAALAARVGTAIGGRERVLVLLRRQDELWTDVARARAADDPAARSAAEFGLDDNRDALTDLLGAEPLDAREVERELTSANTGLAAAVAAIAAGEASAPARIATAAARAVRPAQALARAAERRGAEGRAGSPAAELASLAAVTFSDSAYAQTTVSGVVAAGIMSGPRLSAASSTLQATTETLGQLVASVRGEDAGQRFGASWSAQATALAAYTRAKVADDAPAARAAIAELERVRREIAALLEELDPEAPRSELRKALRKHADAATATIRAQATKSPKVGPRLLETAAAARKVGRVIAMRFADRFPEKFPAR